MDDTVLVVDAVQSLLGSHVSIVQLLTVELQQIILPLTIIHLGRTVITLVNGSQSLMMLHQAALQIKQGQQSHIGRCLFHLLY